MALIDLNELTYRYPGRDRPALRGVNLQVWKGEFVLLAGPSGAGKSTLLRCLNGLVPHFTGGVVSGSVVVAETDVLVAGPRLMSQKVGFVFQNPEAQSVVDTVEDEVALGLELAGVPVEEMRLRIDDVLQLLELDKLRYRKVETLSGGERQRLAIATVMALRPQILALDEPTSQLDPAAAEEVLRALKRLNDHLGLTVILVEQRLERVAQHTHRLVFLDGGRIVVDAPIRAGLAAVSGEWQPPLSRIASGLHWPTMPLTPKEALPLARQSRREIRKPHVARERDLEKRLQGPELLVARDISFSYNGRKVLCGVDLSVGQGEAVVIFGRNGAGKSTLLRCLVGLLKAETGDVTFRGRSLEGLPVAKISQEVAFMPQNPDDLLFADTVVDELRITLANHGLNAEDLDRTPESLLEELGLQTVTSNYPRDLSVGQRQRVALAAVMVHHPALLILDEPTRGLDYESKRKLVAIWQRWLASGMGLLLVTHDVELAAEVADRVIVLNEGRVVAQGDPGDVLRAAPVFACQVGRLFPGSGWTTVSQALAGLGSDGANGKPHAGRAAVAELESEVDACQD
jgi:energy-coupling factor transport system ATP-binding protein